MNIRTILRVLILTVIIFQWNALGDAQMWVESVDIIPLQPTETDIITFDISGWAYQKPSWVEYDDYSQDGLSLQLDLYVDTGTSDAFSEWTYSKQISALPANTYTLELNAIDYDGSVLRDTYLFEFTVVPEPASIAFLGLGFYILRRAPSRLKRKFET